VRRRAEADPAFAAELVKALAIPVEIKIERSPDVAAHILLLDPFVIAGRGEVAFREVFSAMEDRDKKKVIVAYNLAPSEQVTGRGTPRGPALVELMWKAATAQRERMERRA
jgi:hypothetical protein